MLLRPRILDGDIWEEDIWCSTRESGDVSMVGQLLDESRCEGIDLESIS